MTKSTNRPSNEPSTIGNPSVKKEITILQVSNKLGALLQKPQFRLAFLFLVTKKSETPDCKTPLFLYQPFLNIRF